VLYRCTTEQYNDSQKVPDVFVTAMRILDDGVISTSSIY